MNQKTAKLVAEFVDVSKAFERAFLCLGKLRWEIENALDGQSAFSVLIEAGASKGAVSNSKYGAAAWAAVQRGELTAAQFEKLAFDDCRLFAEVPGQVHSAAAIISLRKEHEIPADVAVCLAKAPVAAHELKKLTVEAKKLGYLAEGCGGELLRAVALQAATGAKTLPSREALAERRAIRTGDKNNLGAIAFKLARELGELPSDMPRESLVAMLPVKTAIIRIEGMLREPEGKEAGNDRRGGSRRTAN
ncbi:hypothetical protein JZU56_02865 [bacterium]|nr:hypothetical protein [bacterium]